MQNISFLELEYITTVAQTQNITRAADRLFISQPALSQAIKRVENELGIRIFDRSGGRMKLTDEGQCVISAAIRIQKELRDMENQVQNVSDLKSGTLALGVPHHLGAYIAPQAMAAYHKRYPGIVIKLFEAAPQDLEKMLTSGHVDVAVIPLPLHDPKICYEPFMIDHMVLAMHSRHELNGLAYQKRGSGKKYFNLKDAEHAPFIMAEQGRRIRVASDAVLHKAGIHPEEAYQSVNVEMIKRLVAVGLGVTLLPEFYYASALKEESTNYYYLEPEQDYPWTIACAYVGSRNLTKAARGLIDLLTQP